MVIEFCCWVCLGWEIDKWIVRKSTEEFKDGTELSVLFIKRHFAEARMLDGLECPIEARPITHNSGLMVVSG